MHLYIPEIGDRIVLTADWTFPLYDERRNEGLLKIVKPDFKELRTGPYRWYGGGNKQYEVTLPFSTELIIARVYIRNGASAYSSVTFRIGECPNKALKKKRFWVKLADANKIEYAGG